MPPYNTFKFRFINTDNILIINTYGDELKAWTILEKMVTNKNEWKLTF